MSSSRTTSCRHIVAPHDMTITPLHAFAYFRGLSCCVNLAQHLFGLSPAPFGTGQRSLERSVPKNRLICGRSMLLHLSIPKNGRFYGQSMPFHPDIPKNGRFYGRSMLLHLAIPENSRF